MTDSTAKTAEKDAARERRANHAWPWPHPRDRREQRDAAVAQAEADGQITTEPAPDDKRDEEREAEELRRASLARAGDKLITPVVPEHLRVDEDSPVYGKVITSDGGDALTPEPTGTPAKVTKAAK